MKKLHFLLSVVLMFSCSSVLDTLSNDLIREAFKKKKNYQVGLNMICSNNATKIWYCVSKDEYDRLKEIPQSCETITITGINEVSYSGILGSDSFIHSNAHDCIE